MCVHKRTEARRASQDYHSWMLQISTQNLMSFFSLQEENLLMCIPPPFSPFAKIAGRTVMGFQSYCYFWTHFPRCLLVRVTYFCIVSKNSMHIWVFFLTSLYQIRTYFKMNFIFRLFLFIKKKNGRNESFLWM